MNQEHTQPMAIDTADPKIGANTASTDNIQSTPQRKETEANADERRNDRAARHDTPSRHDDLLERMVRKIEPTGHEISDDVLRDPGAMTPDAPPTDNRS